MIAEAQLKRKRPELETEEGLTPTQAVAAAAAEEDTPRKANKTSGADSPGGNPSTSKPAAKRATAKKKP